MTKTNKTLTQEEKINEFIENSEKIFRYQTYALIALTVNVVILAIEAICTRVNEITALLTVFFQSCPK